MISSPHFLGEFWVRPMFGRSMRLRRFMPLGQAPAYEQLMAAILREDRVSALAILGEHNDGQFVEDFLCWGGTGNLAALVYDNIHNLELAASMDKLQRNNGTPMLQMLRSEAVSAFYTFNRCDQIFLQLLDLLGAANHEVLWLKGVVLARTLYRQPHFRLSVDFDILAKISEQDRLLNVLASLGLSPIWNNPGFCHQFGVGPTGSVNDLAIAPSAEYDVCHNITLQRPDWPCLELKFDPWERGLRAKEIERFFNESQVFHWRERQFKAPGVVDHLILQLAHLHKHGFEGWQWLYDIHLLSGELNKNPEQWQKLVKRCHYEGIDASAWSGLALVRDRLKTAIPSDVITELQPPKNMPLARFFMFTTNTEFLWNSASFPVLLLSTAYLGDRARKQKVLRQTIFPTKQFLSDYYCRGRRLNWHMYLVCLILHWLVVLLPGGLVRRTFGPSIWKSKLT